MTIRRTVLALFAIALLLPMSGCGCRRDCCGSSSYAPPPCAGCGTSGAAPSYLPPGP